MTPELVTEGLRRFLDPGLARGYQIRATDVDAAHCRIRAAVTLPSGGMFCSGEPGLRPLARVPPGGRCRTPGPAVRLRSLDRRVRGLSPHAFTPRSVWTAEERVLIGRGFRRTHIG